MDSDSDSDGSYISSTPPRSTTGPPPPSPPPPPPSPVPLTTLLASYKSRVKVKPSKSSSFHPTKSDPKPPKSVPKRPISDLKPSKSDPKPPKSDPKPLPFQIHRRTYHQNSETRTAVISAVDCIGNVPAGYFSKSLSFSKIRKSCLNLESTEIDSPVVRLETLASQSEKVEPDDMRGVSVNSGNSTVKVVKKYSNLIGGSVEPMPVSSGNSTVKLVKMYSNLIRGCVGSMPEKKIKGPNEGNFVRLNINGYGNKRKYMNKGGTRRNQYSSNNRKHFKRYKSKTKKKGDNDEENASCEEDDLVSQTVNQNSKGQKRDLKYDSESIEEALLGCREDASDENLVKLLKAVYDYDSFREGQLEAIKNVLSGKSTMLVLPTGAGKSLCYQLPAMILPGLTLVVSPIVALMIDQLKQLPPSIQGGLLSSSQTPQEVSETLRKLHEETIKVLFVSPERFSNLEFLSIFSASSSIVSLVVVDEAHCLSEWSHNFRPSYMRLRASLLHATLSADCILAMTATATGRTMDSVMSALEIPSTNLIQTSQLRENLLLSVSLSSNRMKDLLMLIKSSPYKECQSIIIYCKFQFETDLVSKYLCDNNIPAKSYHSGILSKDRRRTQELFCSNKIRVVVATVAFGMGLDKKDIGSVIHYSLPESLEEYVQEIGRAGRDGRLSYCHLLFDDVTYFKLRSLMYSDGVDDYTVNKFIGQVFSNDRGSLPKITSIVKDSASRNFDMKEEVMLTILTQLELGEVQYLQLLPQMNVTCTLNFHETSPALLATKDIVVATVLKKADIKQGQYVFDMPTVANSIGLTATDILNHLHTLKMKGEIRYELTDPAYCYVIVSIPEDFCLLSTQYTNWLLEVESCKVRRFDAMYNAAILAVGAREKIHGDHVVQHSACLQQRLSDYFSGDDMYEVPSKMSQSSPFLRADIKVFLQHNLQAKLTPRSIARIMHGIPSPAYPSASWSKTHFWGRYSQIDFQTVLEAAKEELVKSAGRIID